MCSKYHTQDCLSGYFSWFRIVKRLIAIARWEVAGWYFVQLCVLCDTKPTEWKSWRQFLISSHFYNLHHCGRVVIVSMSKVECLLCFCVAVPSGWQNRITVKVQFPVVTVRPCKLMLIHICLLFVKFWPHSSKIVRHFFNSKPRDWLGRTSPKWPILCRVRCKNLNSMKCAICIDNVKCFVLC